MFAFLSFSSAVKTTMAGFTPSQLTVKLYSVQVRLLLPTIKIMQIDVQFYTITDKIPENMG